MNTTNTTVCNRNDKDICNKNNQVHCRYNQINKSTDTIHTTKMSNRKTRYRMKDRGAGR